MTLVNSKLSARLFKCTRTGVLAASFVAAAAAAHAQTPITIYNTDFDTDAYTTVATVTTPSTYSAGSLSGSPAYVDPTTQLVPTDAASQWQTNDLASNAPLYNVGQNDYVGALGGYGSDANTTGTDQIAFLGGLLGTGNRPGHAIVYDYRSLNSNLGVHPTAGTVLQTFATAGYAPILNLSADVDITKSATTGALSASDTFAFSFQTSGGNLFSVKFVPNGTTGANTTKYNVGLYNSAGTRIGSNLTAVQTNAMYHLNIGAIGSGTYAGGVTLSLTPENTDYTSSGGTTFSTVAYDPADISTASLETVTGIAPTWILSNTTNVAANGGYTNAGSNSLIFDNYTVTGVPEPSTWMMLGLGATGLVWRFRRKAQA